MAGVNFDAQLINNICKSWAKIKTKENNLNYNVRYPLDEPIIGLLKKLSAKIQARETENPIYNFTEDVIIIWKKIVEKSILCLRYYDSREPFKQYSEKVPVAYGIDDLMKYFESYTEFESLLYGGSKYYRDHVIHSFRTWLLGLKVLLNNDGEYLKAINIVDEIEVNILEKLSIWGIIALTHDLGYPLEKAQNIIDKTKSMMSFFISNPSISMNLSFSGIQDNINDFILRLISSKMIRKSNKCNFIESCKQESEQQESEETVDDNMYVARLQPKYYFKLSKSLEESKHGILSSIIIYKLLQYFLESDFSVDEDYYFNGEGARQFYIRREILRAIASHTCHDIYHLDMLSFSYLLIIVDDAQDWGRKRFSDFYFGSNITYDDTNINVEIIKDADSGKSEVNPDNSIEKKMNKTEIEEKVTVKRDVELLLHAIRSQYNQSIDYKTIFKDGLDTKNRNFNLSKKTTITFSGDDDNNIFIVEFHIHSDKNAEFTVKLEKSKGNIESYDEAWIKKVLEIKDNDEFDIKQSISGEYIVWELINK